jgi:hypothetical protein
MDGNPATDREATWQPIASTPTYCGIWGLILRNQTPGSEVFFTLPFSTTGLAISRGIRAVPTEIQRLGP